MKAVIFMGISLLITMSVLGMAVSNKAQTEAPTAFEVPEYLK